MATERSIPALILGLVLAGAAGAQSGPVAQSATPPPVEAVPLDAPGFGAAGLLSPAVTGLPPTIWRGSDPGTLVALMAALDPPVPALTALMRTLMLAEADPPEGGAAGEAHLAARIDWLMANGLVEEALALTQIAGHESAALFRRWAELSLLLGQPEAPCAALRAEPRLSQDVGFRIFCIARAGDWSRAALVLQGARSLGTVSQRQAELLARFLESDLAEDGPPLLPPVRPSPLEFRLFEALGDPLPTAPLPLAFSVLDLSGDNGWKAQVEAAERLARAGALAPGRLRAFYMLRRPAASGGVWDRVAAYQDLDRALGREAPGALEQALIRLWPQMASAGLLVPLAELHATDLAERAPEGRAAEMAGRAVLLSRAYEDLAAEMPDDGDETAFLLAVARGLIPGAAPDLPHAAAVQAGFAGAAMPEVLADLLRQGRIGEVILRGLSLFQSGAQGNGGDLTDAIATLRTVGLEEAARRASLQLMLLDAERARR